MPVTISASTVSWTHRILLTSFVTFLVLYTFSSFIRSSGDRLPGAELNVAPEPAPPAAQHGPVAEEDEPEYQTPVPDEDLIPHGVSVFLADNLSKHLVLPKMSYEDVKWLTYLSEDLNIVTKTYLIDADKAKVQPGTLTVPINKGREVQVYLTYIIDHYEQLPDIVIFTHAHSTAWHNNDIQVSSTPVMLLELNYRRVMRHGYMNLRCHWKPGCPGWIEVNSTSYDSIKGEEFFMAESFAELFPQEVSDGGGIPNVIGTPCCAQFAVTGERIRRHAKPRYVQWRKWITETSLPDDVSGRVMEYLWHFIFAEPSLRGNAERAVLCPVEHVCYCDGYGYCFGDAERFSAWIAKRDKARELSERLKTAQSGLGRVAGEDEGLRKGMKRWRKELKRIETECEAELQYARRRGSDAKMRRGEVGEFEFSG